jgi:hypothetical protein
MKRKRFPYWLVASLALVLALAGAASVWAAPPQMFSGEDVVSFTVGPCDGFDIVVEAVASWQAIEYYDNEGQLTRVHIHTDWDGTATNSVSGASVVDDGHYSQFIDEIGEPDETMTFRGLVFSWNIPGEGIAVLDAGTVTFDPEGNVLHIGGPHQQLQEGTAILCAALD